MSAQKVATGVGVVAFAGLLLSVGLPALLPPDRVPVIVVPATIVTGSGNDNEADPAASSGPGQPPSGSDDDADDRTDDNARTDGQPVSGADIDDERDDDEVDDDERDDEVDD